MTNSTNPLIDALIANDPDFAIRLNLARAATAAYAAINALDPNDPTDDATLDAMRSIMTDDLADLDTLDPDHLALDHDAFDRARALLRPLCADIAAERDYDPDSRHLLSNLALDASLCPMHFCDYAICFDDDDPDCATIRRYFPRHDT